MFVYNLTGFVLPVLLPASALSCVLWSPTVIFIHQDSEDKCRAFLSQASVPLLTTIDSATAGEGRDTVFFDCGSSSGMLVQPDRPSEDSPQCGLHCTDGAALQDTDTVTQMEHAIHSTLSLHEEMSFSQNEVRIHSQQFHL